MPKYLVLANYLQEGMKGLIREGGSQRVEAVRKAVEGVGGKVEAFYFAFGDHDVVTILELPDNSTAVSLSMAIGSSNLTAVRITPLMPASDIDAAARKVIDYRGPGQ